MAAVLFRPEHTTADDDITIVTLPSDDGGSGSRYPDNTDGAYSTVTTDFIFQGPPGTYQCTVVEADVYVDFNVRPLANQNSTFIHIASNITDLTRFGSQQTQVLVRTQEVERTAFGPALAGVFHYKQDATVVKWFPLRGGVLDPIDIQFTDNQGQIFNTTPWNVTTGVPPSQVTIAIRRTPL